MLRQLRLGDILDDYCPRERRLANHTIVAMVGHEIRLTRCTTCDTEHPYKGGKAPRLRKKKSEVAEAYDAVLDSVKKDTDTPSQPADPADSANPASAASPATAANPANPANIVAPEPMPEPEEVEMVRLHRPLIRASLPRVEAQPASRPIPEFTIRQARQGRFQNARPARFAKGQGGATSHSGNSRGPGGPPHGGRQGGRPQGHGSPTRPGPGRHPGQHSGKKRSR
jgi:hypothetical protein